MGSILDAFNNAFPDGPTSNPAEPYKPAIRQAGALIDSTVANLSANVQTALDLFKNGSWIDFGSEAEMNADLNYPEGTKARVLAGDTFRYYTKVGSSGTGSWAFDGDIDATGFAAQVAATQRASAYANQLLPPKFVMIGDSVIQENNIVSGTFVAGYAVGEVEAALAMLGWTLNYAVWRDDARTPKFDGSNSGVSGNTTAQVLARLDDALFLGGSIYLVGVGINDVTGSVPEATIKSNLEAIVNRILASGADKVEIETLRPVGPATLALNSARRPIRVSINEWIRSDLSKRPNVVLADMAAGYEDTANPTKTSAVTISIATPGVISWTAHGLPADTAVKFSTTGALPTGLVAGTTYYVVNVGANDFQVAATRGGAAIATTGTQSGTHTVGTCDYLPKAGSLRDDTHPTEFGAWTCGAPVLMDVFKRVSAPFRAYMPIEVDNRLVSAPFVGSGGFFIPGARCSGQLPNNMRAGMGAGSSTALFAVQNAVRDEYKANGAGKLIACGITPIGAAAYEQIFIDQPSVMATTEFQGKWVYGWCDIEYQAWDAWGNFCLLVNDQSGNTRLVANAAYGALSTVRMPTGRTFMRLKTPYLLVPNDGSVTTLGAVLQVTFHPQLSGAQGFFNFEAWRFGEVPDPKKLFNRS